MKKQKRKPTERETAILKVLWHIGPATVNQVHDILAKEFGTGLTTTQKLMQIMAEKGWLIAEKSRRPHIFTPSETAEQTKSRLLKDLVDKVFDGSFSKLIMQAVGTTKPDEAELERVRQYLDQFEKGPSDE